MNKGMFQWRDIMAFFGFKKFQFLPLLILIGLAHFFVDTMLGIWPIYKSMVEIDIAKAGMIAAAGAFIGEGSQFIFGSFSDKGYRKLLVILGLIIVISAVFFTYTSNEKVLFFLYLATCIGSACFHPCAASLVGHLVPERRGLFMAIFAAAGSLGLATSQLVFNHVYVWCEGQTSILALPIMGLAIVMMYYRFPKGAIQLQEELNHSHRSFKDFIHFFKNSSLRGLYFSLIANQAILWGTIFILPDVLKTLGHNEWICFGGGHLCFIMGAACMAIPGGYLADLYSARQVMLYGGIISFITFYFILFSGGISSFIILSALFVLGSTLALISPLAISIGVRLEPNRSEL